MNEQLLGLFGTGKQMSKSLWHQHRKIVAQPNRFYEYFLFDPLVRIRDQHTNQNEYYLRPVHKQTDLRTRDVLLEPDQWLTFQIQTGLLAKLQHPWKKVAVLALLVQGWMNAK